MEEKIDINAEQKIKTEETKEANQNNEKPKKEAKPKKEKGEESNEKGGKSSKKSKMDVKVAKGARDLTPMQMSIRNKALSIIKNVFKKHGAVEIDTPVFELKETLTGKYGEDSKLIYDLQDQGGEILSLRYDLTVPFARYMVTTHNLPSIKRYHIAKVYRRDQPQMNRGRFREFYQCDFDIAGNNYGTMISDAEVLKVACEILSDLKLGTFCIKINHRKILDATIALAGIEDEKFKTVCSSVDKLDKESWTMVKKELISKCVTEEQCDKLWELVQLKDTPWVLYKKLLEKEDFMKNEKAKIAMEEMKTLIEYIDILEISEYVSFDLSLARGLDYYTGLIYEGVLTNSNLELGSICGGGRYDDLIGMFSGKPISAIGISIGIERVFNILEELYKTDHTIRATETEVLVASIGKNLAKERYKIANNLWKNGIKAEFLYNENPRNDKQLDYALENKIPFVIWIGDDEIKNNKIKVKCLANSEELNFTTDNYVEELIKLKANEQLFIIKEKEKKPKGGK